MMKDKNIQALSFWRQLFHSSCLLKNIFIFVTLFIFLILSLFIMWKRHLEKAALPPEVIISPSLPPSLSQPRRVLPSPSQEELNVLSEKLDLLTSQVNQQPLMQTPQKLVAVEFLRSTLEGWISVDVLKTFLQKNSEPWAQDLFSDIAGVKECKTYPQLKASLALPSLQTLSIWKKIKRKIKAKIKTLIHIRKLDAKGEYQYGQIEDVQNAVQEQNLQHAIELFENLSREEKVHLSSWKEMAQDRLILEAAMRKFLIELSGS